MFKLVLKEIPYFWKAIIGFFAPSAVILVSAVLENSAGGTQITQGEWVTAGCAAVITAGGVGFKGNKRDEPWM